MSRIDESLLYNVTFSIRNKHKVFSKVTAFVNYDTLINDKPMHIKIVMDADSI